MPGKTMLHRGKSYAWDHFCSSVNFLSFFFSFFYLLLSQNYSIIYIPSGPHLSGFSNYLHYHRWGNWGIKRLSTAWSLLRGRRRKRTQADWLLNSCSYPRHWMGSHIPSDASHSSKCMLVPRVFLYPVLRFQKIHLF